MLVNSCGFMGEWLTWLGPRTHRGDLGSLEGGSTSINSWGFIMPAALSW